MGITRGARICVYVCVFVSLSSENLIIRKKDDSNFRKQHENITRYLLHVQVYFQP